MPQFFLAMVLAAVAVWFLVPREAGFFRHILVGGGAAAGLLLFLVVGTILFDSEAPPLADLLRIVVLIAFYGGVLGAAGGAVIWLVGRLPLVASALTGSSGLDPEGERMAEEARQARLRQLQRNARLQVERELAGDQMDEDLWQQAAECAKGDEDRRRRLYIDARIERILSR